jgi:hypothetical protein
VGVTFLTSALSPEPTKISAGLLFNTDGSRKRGRFDNSVRRSGFMTYSGAWRRFSGVRVGHLPTLSVLFPSSIAILTETKVSNKICIFGIPISSGVVELGLL